MKQQIITYLLSMLLCMLGIEVFAHDIAVKNSDGVTIYYVWTNNNTDLAVSYRGSYSVEYENEYTDNVVIPKSVEYNGIIYSVTSIGREAFAYSSGLTSITIPNSVTSIGGGAFTSCSGLTSITIPQGVTDIGDNAFSSCRSLVSVTIPNSVTSIGSGAFSDCSSMTSVTIPNSVTSIGWIAFSGCSNLATITVDGVNTKYDSRDNCNAIIRKSNNELICGCKNTTIPQGVTSIGSGAFQACTGLTSITIPNSVTSIGSYAFAACSSLTSITIPNSVTFIGSGAFWDCSGLTSITIPNSVTSIGESAFSGCSGLTSVTIPNSVTSIGYGAFQGCSGLISVTIDCKEVDSWFSGNKSIKEIVFGNNVTSIGDFWGCSGLTSVTIPNSVTSIRSYAFYDCSGLTSITIPNSVTDIGNYAFEGCGLTSVTVENTSPIAITNSCFPNRANATLYVPKGSKAAYEAADYWKEFKKIVELEQGEDTSVPHVAPTSLSFSAKGGMQSVQAYVGNVYNRVGYAVGNDCKSWISVAIYEDYHLEITAKPNTTGAERTGTVTVYMAAFEGDSPAPGTEMATFPITIKQEEPEEPVATTEEVLKVEDVTVNKEQTVSVDICLDNKKTDLTAYQFDLTLPAGITLAKNNKDKFQVTKTGRYEDESQSLSVSLLEENTYRIVSFSLSNGIIEGTSGAILNAVLAIDGNVADGTYEAQITNIIFTQADGKQLKLADAKFDIVVNNVVEGDANGDNEVNVSDIVEIVNCIMGKPSAGFVLAAADLNGDGEVNVTDIVMVVNIIMAGNGSGARSMEGKADGLTDNDFLTLIGNEDGRMSLSLDNQGSYVASQFDLRLSDGQELKGITLNGNRIVGHHVNYTQMGEGLYRVIVYSLSNEAYKGQAGELLNFDIAGAGTVSVENILFVTARQTERRFASLQSTTTGIVAVKELPSDNGLWFDLKGRRVTDSAKKGIYINNTKKLVVR